MTSRLTVSFSIQAALFLLIASGYSSAITQSDKYCEFQEKICDYYLHPLCNTFRTELLRDDMQNIAFYELNATDINFILMNINRMRAMIANGDIHGYESAANLRVVKWSADYAYLAKMKVKYSDVCTKISLNDDYVLEMYQFPDEGEKWDRFFYQNLLNIRINNDTYGRAPWRSLFRAEFDTIGCVLYQDLDGGSNMFQCFANKAGGDEKPYKMGKPCSLCDIECSKDWPNLCDGLSSTSSQYDYHFTVILILSSIAGTIMILGVIVYVYRLIVNKKSEDLRRPDPTEMATEVLYSDC